MKIVKLFLLMSALTSATAALAVNPLLEPYKTPHQTIPCGGIKNEHYLPAFQEAMKQHSAEIYAIINNPAEATFENTIEALDKSGKLLARVGSPFFNLMSSETNDELQAIAEKVSPLFTEHSNSIKLNEKLFTRVKAVYLHKDKLKLNAEQQMLLKD